MIGALQAHEVAVVSREVWESAGPANLLGAGPSICTSTVIKPDMTAGPASSRDEYRQINTQPQFLAQVVAWVHSWAPDAGICVIDGLEYADDRPSDSSQRVVTVNLHDKSAFFGLQGRRYYGTAFDMAETNRHHRADVHEYTFSRAVLSSDVIVNVPKLKTHKKAGINASLTNAVGLTANSNLLPHHTIGTPKTGGDTYQRNALRFRIASAVLAATKGVTARTHLIECQPTVNLLRAVDVDPRQGGNWWGNDTLWRTILDVNRIVLYGRADGTLADEPQRKTYSVVDSLVAGEGNGPDSPEPIETNLVIAGPSFAAVDLVCAKLMGFDWLRIPYLLHTFDGHDLPIVDFTYGDIRVLSDIEAFDRRLADIDAQECFRFRPHYGWVDYAEANRGEPARS
ncbi:DUF362 domain-containing protein [Mycolicibacterium sp. D5.8-2]|uniref:DUF362 domain-containing protein n=1 Tax=Mycolicibacterium sp. D5.8-2 TaxID=3085903 RepID=UPI00298D3A3A|nr:DUF362 domain-containing protein [Mycolicibacterium sp. D5.8-2]MDW5612050.1 DUF362 domain-containing protein [Mycolicibacterium sp. D5.8-2]